MEKKQCPHYIPSYLSGDVNKNEKHKSNLDVQVV